jgi:hypothetical protein
MESEMETMTPEAAPVRQYCVECGSSKVDQVSGGPDSDLLCARCGPGLAALQANRDQVVIGGTTGTWFRGIYNREL